MENNIADTSNGKIEYIIRGNGPVILYLHCGHSNCKEKLGLEALIKAGYSILTPLANIKQTSYQALRA